LLCALLSGCSSRLVPGDPSEAQAEIEATVRRVTDGDPERISPEIDGKDRVRLIGVDTPETDPERGAEPYGEEAARFTRYGLEGTDVALEFNAEREDDYGRSLPTPPSPTARCSTRRCCEKATRRSPPSYQARATWTVSRRRRTKPARPGVASGVCLTRSSACCVTGGTTSAAGPDKGSCSRFYEWYAGLEE
jgi:hypothetical protein